MQVYFDDDVWNNLHARAKREHTSVSELVRQAVRKKHGLDLEARRKAMMGIAGIWKDRHDVGDSTEYIRKMRRSTRRAERT